MFVVKRSGVRESVQFDKITRRIQALCEKEPAIPPEVVDPIVIAQQVIQGLRNGMTTSELDTLASETLAYKLIDHPAFGSLAARLEISNLHKTTAGDFALVTDVLDKAGLLSADYVAAVQKYKDEIAALIDYSRDYTFDYFGIKTLMRAYLINVGKDIVERPQDMWMRVAIQVVITVERFEDDGYRILEDDVVRPGS